jgi:NADH dehydrogenase subunit H (EC 1.6.5.3)
MISYEIPGALVILSAAVLANSLDMQKITALQSGPFWNWFLFGGPGDWSKIWILPFTVLLSLIYMVSSLAETNRTPFDIPEGESELVAGYHTEYSGMKFANVLLLLNILICLLLQQF